MNKRLSKETMTKSENKNSLSRENVFTVIHGEQCSYTAA